MLQVDRESLGIIGAGRGSQCGPLIFNYIAEYDDSSINKRIQVNCCDTLVTIHQYMLFHINIEFCDARCIQVVEKEGAQNHLLQSNIQNIVPCIILTGNGYPCYAVSLLFFNFITILL